MSGSPVHVLFVALRPGGRIPERATAGSSGFDLFACIAEPGYLEIGADPVLVPSGIAIQAPAGFDVQIRPRSGLGTRGVIATYGTIDADYRGELFVSLYTVGSRGSYRIRHGDRIAQLVVSQLVDVAWREVTALDGSDRGTGGHGSSGR